MKELIAISAAFVVLVVFDRTKKEAPNGRHKFPVEGYIRREQRTLKIVADE